MATYYYIGGALFFDIRYVYTYVCATTNDSPMQGDKLLVVLYTPTTPHMNTDILHAVTSQHILTVSIPIIKVDIVFVPRVSHLSVTCFF